MGNELPKRTNPYKYMRAQDFEVERQENGLFRCDSCQCLMPLPVTWQDGAKRCLRCCDTQTPLEAQTSMAEERAANSVGYDSLPFPVTGAFNGAPAVTALSASTVNLTRGGSSKTLTITGVNLTTSDTWSSSNSAHITVTPSVTSSASVTLTISADGTTTRGDYNLTFNGDTLTPRGILKVR